MKRSKSSYTISCATVAVVFAALLVVARPASADTRYESATTVPNRIAVGKNHPMRSHRASLRQQRPATCCDDWFGRQFVLILGIGY